MNVKSLRSWLLLRPRGNRIVLRSGDKTSEIALDAETNFAKLSESIEAIDPESIEMVAVDGKIIRASKSTAFEDGIDDEDPAALLRIRAQSDAETARFQLFSDHLAQAYRFATEIAFERMVDLFAAVNRRSESLEKSLDATHRLLGKAYQQQVDSVLEAAEAEASGSDPMSNLIGAFVQGAAQSTAEQQAARVAAPTNGKAAKA